MLTKEIQIAVNKGEMLPLMEEFYTIQGEGFHTGTARLHTSLELVVAMLVAIGATLKKVGMQHCIRQLRQI